MDGEYQLSAKPSMEPAPHYHRPMSPPSTRPAPGPDEAVDALYAAPLADFVTLRNALARRLRVEGDRDRAEAVKRLTKPSPTAWGVNQLWRRERKRFDALLAAGEALRAAVASGGGQNAALLEARRRALAALVDRAGSLLEEAGSASNRANRQRIARTLEALSAGGREALGERPGRWVTDLEPAGFGALLGLGVAPPAGGAKKPRRSAKRSPSSAAAAPDRARERRLAAARKKVAVCERAAKAAEEALADARQEVAEAERADKAARRSADEAADALRRAEAEASARAKALAAAHKRAATRERASRRAARALEKARAAAVGS